VRPLAAWNDWKDRMKRLISCCWLIALVGAPAPVVAQTPNSDMLGHGGPVRALAIMPNGHLASAGFDSTIIVWDLSRGQAVRVLRHHETAVNALAVDPRGCIVSGGEDRTIKISCDQDTQDPRTLKGHEGAISALALNWGGQIIASGSWDNSVRLQDAQGNGRIAATHPAPVTSVLFAHDSGDLFSASQDGTLLRTSTAEPNFGKSQQLKLGVAINALAQTQTGHVLLACADGRVLEVDAQLKDLRQIAQLDGPLTAIAVSPDGTSALTGGLRTPVTRINLIDRTTPPQTIGAVGAIWALAYALDGREVFTGGHDRSVRRFNAVTGDATKPAIAIADAPATAETKDRGAQVFRACAVCHGLTARDTHLAGPTLHRIMGRRIASQAGYAYSPSLSNLDIVWTPETIATLFDVGPTKFTPGTKMPEQRLTDPQDRKALVDWLTRVTVP
jgi:cytochrome c